MGSGGVCFWQESGVWRSVLCWCVWQESGFSRREDVFTFNLIYKCTFNAICKDNAAIIERNSKVKKIYCLLLNYY
jgi:hypothetical protein